MKLELLIHRFGNYRKLLNQSVRTIEENFYNLNHLKKFLEQKGISDVTAVTQNTLSEFQHWLFYQPTWKGTARSIANQNRILSVVRGFFKFLTKEGYLGQNPARDLELAREPQSLPRNILTPGEAKKILESVDTTTALGYRDRTILEVFYSTGIRQSELIHLKIEDVNLEEELLKINQGKGGKDRVVPLTRTASSFLETYIKGIRPELLFRKNSDTLFLSVRGRPLDRYNLGKMVKSRSQAAGVKKLVTCHVWRHTCATHLLQNRANLRHVQEILGHESLAMTERYLRITITDLKEAHRKFHPREKDVEKAL